MTIKDFKVGQTVFITGSDRGVTGISPTTRAEKVTKVGRKYVTIRGNWEMQFEETGEGCPFLLEKKGYGAPKLLFPTRAALDEYREQQELKRWLRDATGYGKIERYTADQLRRVKEILEEGTK